MIKSLLVIGLLVCVANSASIEIGSNQLMNCIPFAGWGEAQHSQVVVLKDEIGTAFQISGILFSIEHFSGVSYVRDFSISMTHVESDMLTETFTANYQPGSLAQVYFADSLSLIAENEDELFIELDNPFQYNGEDNLLIDFYFPDGGSYSAVESWVAGYNRSLFDIFLPNGTPELTGDLDIFLPHMILEGIESLDQNTFAAIKIELGGWD